MFGKVAPITLSNHRNKKIRKVSDYAFAREFNLASIMVHEFSRAAATYPIVFVEDKTHDAFRPVVMLGLEQKSNLFVQEGKWKASYIPAIIRRYPFTLAKTTDEGKYALCIDEACELVNEEEGQPLFDEKGEPAELLVRAKQYLGELQQMEAFTMDFSRYFAAKNLFTPLNMKLRQSNQMKSITGCYVINEERLGNLSDEAFLEIRGRKFLAPVYAHLVSVAQMEHLVQMRDEK